MKIELNKQQELEPLLELKIPGGHIDLHNDYQVEKINYENNTLEIYLLKSLASIDYTPKSNPEVLKLVFFNCKITNGDINSLDNERGNSFDNLSKSSHHTDKWFYTFSFIEGGEYEIECGDAFLEA